jgi:hypothetical protein
MSIGSGLAGWLGIAKETTWGTPTTTGMRFREITGESLELKTENIQSEGIDAGNQAERWDMEASNVTRMSAGDVEFDMPTKGAGLWIQSMINSWLASAPVQLTTSGVYQQIHVMDPIGSSESSLTIQKGVPGTDGVIVPVTYNGCVCTSWEVAAKVGEFLHAKLSYDGQDERTPTSTPTLGLAAATPTFPQQDGGFFHFAQGSLMVGGTPTLSGGIWSIAGPTALANVTEVTISQDIPRSTERIFVGTNGLKAYQIPNGKRAGKGSLSAEFAGETEYQKFVNATQFALAMEFIGPVVGSASNHARMQILLSGVKYDGESPKIDGYDLIEVSRDIRWKLPIGSAPLVQVVIDSTDTAI